MRVRLACAAAVLGGAGAVAAGGNGTAAEAARVEPGAYQVVTPAGHCLSGTGEADVSLWLGPCEGTGWQMEVREGGYVIRHGATGNCLAPSLVRIYPQRVGTRDCAALDELWTLTVLQAADGRQWVRVTRPDYYTSLSWLSDREPVFLLPQSQTGNQRWELRKI
ncbi:hypothetical protein [Actinocorallia populi]|uniref:hypothetical protein n=1 Tax=Actinocorallia populi TaxID=2079200 RepID=UPI001300527C|nr:hypothetical protein [Actinocorallia populi]